MSDQIVGAVAVTPSDSTEIRFRALYIGVAGNVTIVTLSDQTVLFANVPVGWLDVAGKKVMSTGTAATSIVALS